MSITVLAATGLPATLTIEQAGQLLGISRGAAYRAAAAGQIPTIRVGRRLLVPTALLLEMLGIDHPDQLGQPAIAGAVN